MVNYFELRLKILGLGLLCGDTSWIGATDPKITSVNGVVYLLGEGVFLWYGNFSAA